MPSPPLPPVLCVLLAEKGELLGGNTSAKLKEFTGTGYVENPKINWTYTAEKEGTYVLEFRYGMIAWVQKNSASVQINNEKKSLQCFYTGNENYWAVDKLIVNLKKGENKISFEGDSRMWLDNINIIPFY